MKTPVFTVADDVSLWVADGGSIHIKTRDPYGDPVELSEEDALRLADILRQLVDQLRA